MDKYLEQIHELENAQKSSTSNAKMVEKVSQSVSQLVTTSRTHRHKHKTTAAPWCISCEGSYQGSDISSCCVGCCVVAVQGQERGPGARALRGSVCTRDEGRRDKPPEDRAGHGAGGQEVSGGRARLCQVHLSLHCTALHLTPLLTILAIHVATSTHFIPWHIA
jgi:hypothetical protein